MCVCVSKITGRELKRRTFPQEAECVVSCCSTQRDKRGKTQSGSNTELVWKERGAGSQFRFSHRENETTGKNPAH